MPRERIAIGRSDIVPDDKESAVVDLHLPGASDLSGVDGFLRVALGSAWNDDTRTVRLDKNNEPLLVVQLSDEGGPASDLFGADFVSFGDEVGTGTMEDEYGTWEVSYKKAVFETDDGALEANPGEPFVATIDGGIGASSCTRASRSRAHPIRSRAAAEESERRSASRCSRVDDAARARSVAPLSGAPLAGPARDCSVSPRPRREWSAQPAIIKSTTRSFPGVGVIATGGLFARFAPGWRNACSVHGSFTTSM